MVLQELFELPSTGMSSVHKVVILLKSAHIQTVVLQLFQVRAHIFSLHPFLITTEEGCRH